MGQLWSTETLQENREDTVKLDFADACLEKSNASRDLGDYIGSLGWLEQSLLVRAEVLGSSVNVSYNPPFIANLIAIGETHLSLRRFDRAFVYFLRAKGILDPLLALPETRHTSAPMQYVNLTAGTALVLTAVAKCNHKPTLDLLERADPLKVAEQTVEQAAIKIVALEGARAPMLVSLYHILARIYLMTNKRMSALRVMQRCLGLTLQLSQTKKIFTFLSYTRNVLDTVKELTLLERVVIRIQQWWRDKRAAREKKKLSGNDAGEAFSYSSPAHSYLRPSPALLHGNDYELAQEEQRRRIIHHQEQQSQQREEDDNNSTTSVSTTTSGRGDSLVNKSPFSVKSDHVVKASRVTTARSSETGSTYGRSMQDGVASEQTLEHSGKLRRDSSALSVDSSNDGAGPTSKAATNTNNPLEGGGARPSSGAAAKQTNVAIPPTSIVSAGAFGSHMTGAAGSGAVGDGSGRVGVDRSKDVSSADAIASMQRRFQRRHERRKSSADSDDD